MPIYDLFKRGVGMGNQGKAGHSRSEIFVSLIVTPLIVIEVWVVARIHERLCNGLSVYAIK